MTGRHDETRASLAGLDPQARPVYDDRQLAGQAQVDVGVTRRVEARFGLQPQPQLTDLNQIVRNANWKLARYAWSELLKATRLR